MPFWPRYIITFFANSSLQVPLRIYNSKHSYYATQSKTSSQLQCFYNSMYHRHQKSYDRGSMDCLVLIGPRYFNSNGSWSGPVQGLKFSLVLDRSLLFRGSLPFRFEQNDQQSNCNCVLFSATIKVVLKVRFLKVWYWHWDVCQCWGFNFILSG